MIRFEIAMFCEELLTHCAEKGQMSIFLLKKYPSRKRQMQRKHQLIIMLMTFVCIRNLHTLPVLTDRDQKQEDTVQYKRDNDCAIKYLPSVVLARKDEKKC